MFFFEREMFFFEREMFFFEREIERKREPPLNSTSPRSSFHRLGFGNLAK